MLIFQSVIFGDPFCDTLYFKSNDSSLKGFFYPSPKPYSPTLIFSQGFMETGDIWEIGKTLSSRGINVFMFDFRGCFDSGGKQGLLNSQEDIGSALRFLKSGEMIDKYRIDTSNIIIGGYSYGGHMSMLYAIYHPKVTKIISISGGDLGILAKIIRNDAELRSSYSKFFKSIQKPDGPIDFKYEDPLSELEENPEYFNILANIDKLNRTKILLIGGADDTVVSLEDYILPLYREFKRIKHSAVDLILYQTGHSYKNSSEDLLQDIFTWITNN